VRNGRACQGANADQSTGQLQGQSKQRVVTAEEAEKLINEGWEYVGTLPNKKVVVKKS